MVFTGDKGLDEALVALDTILADRDFPCSLVLVGGGSLLLMGLISRPTKDLDIVALADPDGYKNPDPLPEPLQQAILATARALDLPEDWLNTGPASLMDFGLPPGAEERVEIRRYGHLEVHLLGRRDQIALKVYAATDSPPGSKHEADLRTLGPSEEELLWAARWARTHDASEPFLHELIAMLGTFGVEISGDDL